MSPRKIIRNLADTPFSADRLFIWTVGIIAFSGMVGMIVMGILRIPIPLQVQSATMFCLGVAAARIEKKSG